MDKVVKAVEVLVLGAVSLNDGGVVLWEHMFLLRSTHG
jgi:hypothetical protein